MTSTPYNTYSTFKQYTTPTLKPKHIAAYDAEFWKPCQMTPNKRVLEVGCGTGHFLLYLQAKGVIDFAGLDLDTQLATHLPEAIKKNVSLLSIEEYLQQENHKPFDVIVLFDVLEHFSYTEGEALLRQLSTRLQPGGYILTKTPNMGSPWGLQYQYGDLTHKAAYNSFSLTHLAINAGLQVERCFGQKTGSPFRRMMDRIISKVLSKCLMCPSAIWSSNFFALIKKAA